MDVATGTPVNLNYDMRFKFTGKPGGAGLELAPEKIGAADWENPEQADEFSGLPN